MNDSSEIFGCYVYRLSLVVGFDMTDRSERILLYFFHLMSRFKTDVDDDKGVLRISKITGLWSKDSSFRLWIFLMRGYSN